jgi:hypothetical protein
VVEYYQWHLEKVYKPKNESVAMGRYNTVSKTIHLLDNLRLYQGLTDTASIERRMGELRITAVVSNYIKGLKREM